VPPVPAKQTFIGLLPARCLPERGVCPERARRQAAARPLGG
jgi:hypothetical protein